MLDKYSAWYLELAAAWLQRHGWSHEGEAQAPAPLADHDPFDYTDQACIDAAALHAHGEPEAIEQIDIACWPALVAPFYD
jgi:hypothetical protein